MAALRNVSPWRLGFSCGDPYQFDTLERECGLDDNSYHGEKTTRVSFFQIGIDSSWIMPEAEPAAYGKL